MPPGRVSRPGATYQTAGQLRSGIPASVASRRTGVVITAMCVAVAACAVSAIFADSAPGLGVVPIMLGLPAIAVVYLRLRVGKRLRVDEWGVHRGRLLLPWGQLAMLEVRDGVLWAWPVPAVAIMQKRAVRRLWRKKCGALRVIRLAQLDAAPDEVDGAIRRYRPSRSTARPPTYWRENNGQ